jgi:hypothetical protein
LKGIHKEIAGMVKGLKSFEPSEEKLGALRKAAMAWLQHAELEDRIAYPAFRDAGVDDTLLAEAMVKADLAMTLLADLAVRRPTDDLFTGGVRVFLQMVPQMIALEERKSSGLFAQAQKAGVDMKALGEALQSEMPGAEYEAEEQYRHPSPRHLRGAGPTRTSKENSMRGNYRERDERGRFTDDDDRRRGGGDYERRSSRGRSRYDDGDDDGRGWHGDPRGHAEASRRGWDERRSGSRYDDDDRRYSRSRDDGDDDRRGRRQGGWFGDSEGHSEASRRGWDNPGHGDSGWYGDSRGHSEASRRGWDNPNHGPSGWYGDSRGHSEASRRGWDNPDHGESGWYGDPDGHSEASRRGWRNRR